MRTPPITYGTKLAAAKEAVEATGSLDKLVPPFAGGFNSHAYRVGEKVVKIAKRSLTEDAAINALAEAQEFYKLLSAYLGKFVAKTAYTLIEDHGHPSRFLLVSCQPYIEGTSIAKATFDEILHSGESDGSSVLHFLEANLTMYAEEGQIGDVAAIEGRLFDPFKTKNVILGPNGIPILTDVDRGKIQKSAALGPLWTGFIACGVRRGRERLLEAA